MKEYGIFYAKPLFPRGHKLEWLNHAFGQMPKDLSEMIKDLAKSINEEYSDNIIIPLDNNTTPGIVTEPEVIEEVANLVYDGFNQIFNDLVGESNCYVLVWSIGEMGDPNEIIKQSTRIKDIPTLHNVEQYPVLIKVGNKINSIKEPGIYKV